MKRQNKHRGSLSVTEIKRILSEEEFDDVKNRIEYATHIINKLGDLLPKILFLHNGKLLYGNIDYAAFRRETISLIFEVASRNFRRTAKSGPKAYNEFLEDLGDEVGFTFARDLISKLIKRQLVSEIEDFRKLLALWGSYENDTGAGETNIKSCSKERIIIQLRNNPLRRKESSLHAHCGFYIHYIRSLLNEFYSLRARTVQQRIEDSKIQARKVTNVVEQPDADDNCVFIAQVQREVLTRSFDALFETYAQFYKLSDSEDFSPCMSQARAVLVIAQMEVIGLKAERTPRQLFRIFQGLIPKNDFRRMDEVYQRITKYIHKEATTSRKLTRDHAWDILRDLRRSLYVLEFLKLDENQRTRLQTAAIKNDRLVTLEEIIEKAQELSAEKKSEVKRLIVQLKKGVPEEQSQQKHLVMAVKELGGKVWEIAKPVLVEIISGTVRKQCGL